MDEISINVAEAKKRFSELIGQVAFGKKRLLITKRGKPMARMIPVDESARHVADAQGWLENDDPFFAVIDRIVEDRTRHIPRILGKPEPE